MSADSESDFKSVLHAKGGGGCPIQLQCPSPSYAATLYYRLGWDLG